MNKLCVICLTLACLTQVDWVRADANQIMVKNKDDLKRHLNSALPGTHLVLPAGELKDWQVSIQRSGTADAPIVIEGQGLSNTVFSGKSTIVVDKASHIVLRRFGVVKNNATAVTLNGARHVTLEQCRFEQVKANEVVLLQHSAKSNRIERCEFTRNPSVNLRIKINSLAKYPTNTVVRENRFSDVPPIKGNGRETIQIGQSHILFGKAKPQILVENNYFIRCNGEPEIISNKSSGNTYRGNTFIDCQGGLVMRGGSDCLIENNRFEGGLLGIRLNGSNHIVRDNVIWRVSSSGIRLRYGVNDKNPAFYLTVIGCVIENNTIVDAQASGISIGTERGADLLRWPKQKKKLLGNPHKYGKRFDMDRAPYNNTIRHNIVVSTAEASLIVHDQAPDNQVKDNVLYSTHKDVKTMREGNMFRSVTFVDRAVGDFTLKEISGLDSASSASIGSQGSARNPSKLIKGTHKGDR